MTTMEMLGLLRPLDGYWARAEAAVRPPVPLGSMATTDAEVVGGQYVSIHAGQAMLNALDHLLAWRSILVGGGMPIQAQMSLLRVALEASVRCRWLVDGSVDSMQRVARGYATKREDLDERRRFESSRRPTAPPLAWTGDGMRATDRLAELEAARQAAGVPEVGRANVTQLMTDHRLEGLWRFASGVAHGMEWVLVGADRTPMEVVDAPPTVAYGSLTASDASSTALTEITVRHAEKALVALEGYHGRGQEGEA